MPRLGLPVSRLTASVMPLTALSRDNSCCNWGEYFAFILAPLRTLSWLSDARQAVRLRRL